MEGNQKDLPKRYHSQKTTACFLLKIHPRNPQKINAWNVQNDGNSKFGISSSRSFHFQGLPG